MSERSKFGVGFLFFLLTIVVVFAISACTSREEEEEIILTATIPIETVVQREVLTGVAGTGTATQIIWSATETVHARETRTSVYLTEVAGTEPARSATAQAPFIRDGLECGNYSKFQIYGVIEDGIVPFLFPSEGERLSETGAERLNPLFGICVVGWRQSADDVKWILGFAINREGYVVSGWIQSAFIITTDENQNQYDNLLSQRQMMWSSDQNFR